MVHDGEWIKEKLTKISEKQAILNSLKEMLTKWEEEIDWASLPKEKQSALMGLAEESVTTLTVMIEKLGSEIKEGLDEIKSGKPE